MFRPMRRKPQQLSESESIALLQKGTYGVLSIMGEDGYPYGVPMNYVYDAGILYFHGSTVGLRREAVGEGCKASFTVVERWDVDAPNLATLYRSVILFGHVRPLPHGEATKAATLKLGLRFLNDEEAVRAEIEREAMGLCCYIFEIEHMSGKEAKALAADRRANHA